MFLIHYDVGTHIQLQTGFVSRKNAKGKFLKTENFVTVQDKNILKTMWILAKPKACTSDGILLG